MLACGARSLARAYRPGIAAGGMLDTAVAPSSSAAVLQQPTAAIAPLGVTATSTGCASLQPAAAIAARSVSNSVVAAEAQTQPEAGDADAGPSDLESKLLDASQRLDDAINSRDENAIRELLAPDVRLHHDGLTLNKDLSSADDVTDWFKSYWGRYEFRRHEAICGAVDENDPPVAFSFWIDEGVKRKDANAPPRDTVGIWHHVFDPQSLRIKDIYFLRQLTDDEEGKVENPPPQRTEFDARKFADPVGVEPNAARARMHERRAHAYMDIWRTGDADEADHIMVDDVAMYDPVFGTQKVGRQNFKEYIRRFVDAWKTDEMEVRVAATPGNKAFIFYKTAGRKVTGLKQGEKAVYGLNMLVFDEKSRITDVVGLRQPLDEAEGVL